MAAGMKPPCNVPRVENNAIGSHASGQPVAIGSNGHPPAHPPDLLLNTGPTSTFDLEMSTVGWLGCCGLFFLRTTRLPFGKTVGPGVSNATATPSLFPLPACLSLPVACVFRFSAHRSETCKFTKNAWDAGDRMQNSRIDRLIIAS